jgi:hypothetical protein
MQQPLQQGAQLGLLSYPLPIDVELAVAAGLSGGAAGSASAMGTGPTVDVGIVAQVGLGRRGSRSCLCGEGCGQGWPT